MTQQPALTSTVITLQALDGGQIHGGSGRGVHGLWFDAWKEINPSIGDVLHQPNQVSPLILSPLMGLPRPVRGVSTLRAGDQPWLRIATLSAASAAALQDWLAHLPGVVCIAGVSFQVLGVARTPAEHPWAASASYQDLAAPRLFDPYPPDRWTIRLETPTVFHGVSGQFPFPLPDGLAKSWLARWNEFAPLLLPEDFPARVRAAMLINSYQLETVPVRYGKRLTIGCVGQITLRAGELLPPERAVFDLLCAYAFYAGAGQHTSQGMGMCRAALGR